MTYVLRLTRANYYSPRGTSYPSSILHYIMKSLYNQVGYNELFGYNEMVFGSHVASLRQII